MTYKSTPADDDRNRRHRDARNTSAAMVAKTREAWMARPVELLPLEANIAVGIGFAALTRGGSRDPQYDRVRPRLGLARIALAAGEVANAAGLALAACEEAPRDTEALALTLYTAKVLGRLPDVAAALVARADVGTVRRAGAQVGVAV